MGDFKCWNNDWHCEECGEVVEGAGSHELAAAVYARKWWEAFCHATSYGESFFVRVREIGESSDNNVYVIYVRVRQTTEFVTSPIERRKLDV